VCQAGSRTVHRKTPPSENITVAEQFATSLDGTKPPTSRWPVGPVPPDAAGRVRRLRVHTQTAFKSALSYSFR